MMKSLLTPSQSQKPSGYRNIQIPGLGIVLVSVLPGIAR